MHNKPWKVAASYKLNINLDLSLIVFSILAEQFLWMIQTEQPLALSYFNFSEEGRYVHNNLFRLHTLFQPFQFPASKTIYSLWGLLLLITASMNPGV